MYLTDIAVRLLQPKPKEGLFKFDGAHLYGDSIMEAGIGEMLERLGAEVKCFAQAGDTAALAARRFAWDVRCMYTVVLEHGTNDITNGVDPVPNLRRMATYALAEGRRVIFTGIPQRDVPAKYDWERANSGIYELAKELGCNHAYWPKVSASFGPNDRLHPDRAMAERLADRLYRYL